MDLAPIALFVYKRPDHLSRTLDALKNNYRAEESVLYIFAEGVKADATDEDIRDIRKVREIIHQLKGFKEIIIHEAELNLGCANSMTRGISKVLEEHDSVIVLEDDIVTHPLFLSYCNKGLALYANNEKVYQIGAFMFPCHESLPEIFFSSSVFCWGWATWKRAWNKMSMDADKLKEQILKTQREYEFDLEGTYPYLNSLRDQIDGKIDAWDICWYSTIFLAHGISVYPGHSLSENIGLDGSGTHFKTKSFRKISTFNVPANLLEHFPPQSDTEKEYTRPILIAAIKEWTKISLRRRIYQKADIIFNSFRKIFHSIVF